MNNDYCPKCNALTEMDVSMTESFEKDKEGKAFKIITASNYCNVCRTFVRSEDNRLPLAD